MVRVGCNKSLRGMRKDDSVRFKIDSMVNEELGTTWGEKKILNGIETSSGLRYTNSQLKIPNRPSISVGRFSLLKRPFSTVQT